MSSSINLMKTCWRLDKCMALLHIMFGIMLASLWSWRENRYLHCWNPTVRAKCVLHWLSLFQVLKLDQLRENLSLCQKGSATVMRGIKFHSSGEAEALFQSLWPDSGSLKTPLTPSAGRTRLTSHLWLRLVWSYKPDRVISDVDEHEPSDWSNTSDLQLRFGSCL